MNLYSTAMVVVKLYRYDSGDHGSGGYGGGHEGGVR